jgi:hypothetical protein
MTNSLIKKRGQNKVLINREIISETGISMSITNKNGTKVKTIRGNKSLIWKGSNLIFITFSKTALKSAKEVT